MRFALSLLIGLQGFAQAATLEEQKEFSGTRFDAGARPKTSAPEVAAVPYVPYKGGSRAPGPFSAGLRLAAPPPGSPTPPESPIRSAARFLATTAASAILGGAAAGLTGFFFRPDMPDLYGLGLAALAVGSFFAAGFAVGKLDAKRWWLAGAATWPAAVLAAGMTYGQPVAAMLWAGIPLTIVLAGGLAGAKLDRRR